MPCGIIAQPLITHHSSLITHHFTHHSLLIFPLFPTIL
nr:MAG TPA: hypothetical protein [Caudoviricetes sp.]